MTRKEIESSYTLKAGYITTLGKFEGEPIYSPWFYQAYVEGLVDDTEIDEMGVQTDYFDVNEDDIEQFPELEGVKRVKLWEDDSGFIFCEPC